MTVVEAQGDDGDMFSSTRVRELLAEGDVAAAAEMLGSWWRISGVIVGGAGRGTIMGFPTANIRLEEGVTLKHGIYECGLARRERPGFRRGLSRSRNCIRRSRG